MQKPSPPQEEVRLALGRLFTHDRNLERLVGRARPEPDRKLDGRPIGLGVEVELLHLLDVGMSPPELDVVGVSEGDNVGIARFHPATMAQARRRRYGREAMPAPRSFRIEVEGRTYSGHYNVEDGALKVGSAYGSKNRRVGKSAGLEKVTNLVLQQIVQQGQTT